MPRPSPREDLALISCLLGGASWERGQETQCGVARVGRVEDPEMGGGEDRVELPLADKVDRLSAGKTGAGGEIMRLAVAILGGKAGEDAVRQAVVDEVGCSRLVADDQVKGGARRLACGVQDREQLRMVGTVLVAYRAARREAAEARLLEEVGRVGRAVNDA